MKYLFKSTSHCFASVFILLIPIFALPGLCDGETLSSVVQINDERLSVRVSNLPLDEVFSQISEQTGIQVFFYGTKYEPVSAEFSDLPLEKGLQRLLGDVNHVVIYGPENAETESFQVIQILIYSEKGRKISRTPRRLIPYHKEPEESAPSLASLSKAVKDNDPDVRAEAVEGLWDFESDYAMTLLRKVLQEDENPDIRAAAAEVLGDQGNERAIGALVIAIRDRDASVRESAVEALGQIGGEQAIAMIRKALKDGDEDVRGAAEDMLEWIE